MYRVSDPDWHDELVLVAEMSSVNNQIARFVLRLLDADAGRRQQISVADEAHLAGRLVDLGHALQDRATRRAAAPGATRRAAAPGNGGPPLEVPGSIRRQIGPGRMTTAGGKP